MPRPDLDPTSDVRADFGVIGVGSLAEAIVTGLSDVESPAPTILLSPRNPDRSSRLAGRFPNVRVAESNQAAVSDSRTVVLCVRPQDADDAIGPLDFTPDQQVVSVMARLSVADLTTLVAPATEISRALPSPAIAERKGFTPLFPAGSAADRLFDLLGGSMVLAEEQLLDAAGTAAATVASHFSYLQVTSGWLADRGVDRATADAFIASVFAGVGRELVGVSDLTSLAAAHATPGGTNEGLERHLREAGFFATLSRGLDELYASVHRPADDEPGGR